MTNVENTLISTKKCAKKKNLVELIMTRMCIITRDIFYAYACLFPLSDGDQIPLAIFLKMQPLEQEMR